MAALAVLLKEKRILCIFIFESGSHCVAQAILNSFYLYFYFLNLFLIMCLCVGLCACPPSPEELFVFPGTRLTEHCAPSCVGTGN